MSRTLEEIQISLINKNELNANTEDSATFNRLLKRLEKRGMLELPVVIRLDSGRFKIFSGEHRILAWEKLGHETVPAIVYADGDIPFDSKEDEFNEVNNMNRVRGEFSPGKARQIVMQNELDVTRLDIFKHKFASIDISAAAAKATEDLARKQRLVELTHAIAQEIALDVMSTNTSPILAIITKEHKLVVLIRVSDDNGTRIRRYTDHIVTAIKDAIAMAVPEVLGEGEEVSHEQGEV